MNRLADLNAYRSVLPYACENFGVYQPLLGWKSKRSVARFTGGFRFDRLSLYAKAFKRFPSDVVTAVAAGRLQIQQLAPAHFTSPVRMPFGSILLRELARSVPSDGTPQAWDQVTPAFVQSLLDGPVRQAAEADFSTLSKRQRSTTGPGKSAEEIVSERLTRESAAAGLILELKAQNAIADLHQLVHGAAWSLTNILGTLGYTNPIDSMDPNKDLDRVGMSPIGIVHLFRQYFFELDTFLGTPVSHVWLSPGATVELIEISTRKTIVERTQELALQTTSKTEETTATQDDLSDAVKDENQSNVKFGASVTANESWIWGSASETGSFEMDNTQKNARETTHKQMRQQSQKLTEEIKKNFKTTFKTVTEDTDTSSKRYVLANTTDHLINYELRRKMRQVGVQVQDIGSYLCWQTYVDDPAEHLGVGKMVHIGAPPEVWGDPNPDAIPVPQPIKGEPISISLTWPYDDDTTVYWLLVDQYQLFPPKPGYVYDRHELITVSGDPTYPFEAVPWDHADIDDGAGSKEHIVTSLRVSFIAVPGGIEAQEDNPKFTLQLTVFYRPSMALIAETDTANKAKVAAASNEKLRAAKDAFLKASRDRIKAASNIQPRPYEELREEERIVVYRKLIQDMLTHGLSMPDHRTQHIVAELLNSIFDVDKMLYFVAPEWWRPRAHSRQEFGGILPMLNKDGTPVLGDDGQPVFASTATSKLSPEAVVDWGDHKYGDNYYITEDSAPAKLGSSLGWLLQLDGDNMRNAFMNAPWVKAVVPIRPGRERAAINWLKHVEGLDGIGPKDMYSGIEPGLKGKSMLEVLNILADNVAQKHKDSMTLQSFPDPAAPGDPASTITATPVDQVYEHGFYPLQNSFRLEPGGNFEVFDQWIEILPTDQVVPVEVRYDPKTGRQV